jgi:hypothetical protein
MLTSREVENDSESLKRSLLTLEDRHPHVEESKLNNVNNVSIETITNIENNNSVSLNLNSTNEQQAEGNQAEAIVELLMQTEQMMQNRITKFAKWALLLNLISLFLIDSPETLYYAISYLARKNPASEVFAIMVAGIDAVMIFAIMSVLLTGYLEGDWETRDKLKIFMSSFKGACIIDFIVFILEVWINDHSWGAIIRHLFRFFVFFANYKLIQFGHKLGKILRITDPQEWEDEQQEA